MAGSMPVQLLNIPTTLQFLSISLSEDWHIKSNVNVLISRTRKCGDNFKRMMTNDYKDLLSRKDSLQRADNAATVDTSNMQTALKTMLVSLTSLEDEINSIQGDIHCTIELCKESVKHKQEKVCTAMEDITKFTKKVKKREQIIQTLQHASKELEEHAQELLALASANDRAADENRNRAVGGLMAGSLAALVLAPLTLGGSLAVHVVGMAYQGVKVYTAIEYRQRANDATNTALAKVNEIRALRSKIGIYESKIRMCETQRTALETDIENLNRDERTLNSLTNELQDTSTFIYQLIASFQDIEGTFYAVNMATEAFEAVQNAYNRDQTAREGWSQDKLMKLKIKWDLVETILKSNGVNPRLTYENAEKDDL